MNNRLTEHEIISLFKENIKNSLSFRRIIQSGYNADDFDKEIDLGAKCLLDRNIKIIYPLDEKQTSIIRDRFGINDSMEIKTLTELADVWGYTSGASIRQIEEKVFNRLASRVYEVKNRGIIDDKTPEEVQKLAFVNYKLHSFDDYLSSISSKNATKIDEKSILLAAEEQILNDIKQRMGIFPKNSKEFDIAIKLLLDRKNINVYPLDEIQTKVVRETVGINDEMEPKTYKEIGVMIDKSATRVGDIFDSSVRKLNSRIIEVKDLLLMSKIDISEEDQKLIFVNPNLKKFDDYSDEAKIGKDLKDKILPIVEGQSAPMMLEDLGLSVRAFNCIRRTGIASVQELIKIPTSGLGRIRNLGDRAYQEVIDKVHSLGFKFKDELSEEKESNTSVTNTDGLGTVTQRRNDLLSKGKQLTEERDTLLQQESELDSRIASAVQNKGNIQNGVQNGTTKK